MKTLILYESKHGATANAVAILAGKLAGEVKTAKVSEGTIPPLADFDTVVIGGPIYFGKLDKSLSTYAAKHREELLGKKLGLFICGAHPKPGEREKELSEAFPEALLNHAAAKDIFGFQLHFQELNKLEKNVVKSILREKEDKEGLDEEKIAEFARNLSD